MSRRRSELTGSAERSATQRPPPAIPNPGDPLSGEHARRRRSRCRATDGATWARPRRPSWRGVRDHGSPGLAILDPDERPALTAIGAELVRHALDHHDAQATQTSLVAAVPRKADPVVVRDAKKAGAGSVTVKTPALDRAERTTAPHLGGSGDERRKLGSSFETDVQMLRIALIRCVPHLEAYG